MPVTWQQSTNDFSIIVWHSTEPLEVLLKNAEINNEETLEWKAFKSESRKREWLTVRNALQILIPHSKKVVVLYDVNGKPLLEKGYISISHSQNYIAVMKTITPGIGIDIESINPRILKLAQKFLSENEKEHVITDNRLEKFHVIWGAKEVLYKIHSIGGINFKKDLLVHSFKYENSGIIDASILKKGYEENFKVRYEKLDGYMLTWAHRSNS